MEVDSESLKRFLAAFLGSWGGLGQALRRTCMLVSTSVLRPHKNSAGYPWIGRSKHQDLQFLCNFGRGVFGSALA